MNTIQADTYERFMSFFARYGKICNVKGKKVFDVFYVMFDIETQNKIGHFDFFIPIRGKYIYRYNDAKRKRYMNLETIDNQVRMTQNRSILPEMV